MEKIKIVLVDDQTLFVESLKTVLETRADDLQVVGVANDGKRGVEVVAETSPDIVLMDVRMPLMNGVESTKLIKESYPDVRVLMLTTFDDDQYVVEALRLGAVGYLLKNMPPAELISAIRAVYEGGVLISPQVANKLLGLITNAQSKVEELPEDDTERSLVNQLSSREKEILQLMAEGLDNKEIAGKLYIAEQTVKNYVSIIYSKLGVRDRVQASRMVLESRFTK
jgi:DNA-binding NarL/FixJ family response regulator